MLTKKANRCLLASTLALAMVPSPGFGQVKTGQPPSKEAKRTIVIQVRARDGGFLAQGVRDRIRSVPNVGRAETYLDGKTTEGVQVVGVEPGSTLQFRSGNQALAAAIIQARGFKASPSSGSTPRAIPRRMTRC